MLDDTKETDPKGNQTLYEYDRNGNCTKITDAEGNVYTYQYDANNQLIKVTDPMNHAISYTYNVRGELESVTEAGGGRSTFAYDGNGNLIKEVNPLGGTKTYTYDSLNRLIGMEDENGYQCSYSYDAVGNIISYTDGNQNKWSYEYDAMSRITSVTDENGGHMALSYGSRGELLKIIDQEGAETSYIYDSLGRMIQMCDALDNYQSFVYDSLDRIIKQIDGNGNATEYTYSPSGNLLSIKDPEGKITAYTYNALGQILTETDALGNMVRYAYDALGQVTSITDPMGSKTSFTYTARGEIATVTDAKGGVIAYRYDGNGNLTKTTDALGNVTVYEYDAMNNQIKESASSSGGQTCATIYQYDKKGQMVKKINPLSQEKTYSYDGNGNVVTILDEDQYKTEVVYDLNNQATSMRYSDGKEAVFRYNKKGELVELKDWNGTAKLEYDKTGQLKIVTDHNGKTTGYGYDANGNNTSIDYPDGSKVSYSYDKNNRMTKVADAEKQITQYAYDSTGNTLQIQQPCASTSYTYNKNGQPVKISYQMEDGTQLEDNLTYDAANHMVIGRNVENGEKSEYTYNALYMRVKNVQTLEQMADGNLGNTESKAGEAENQTEAFKTKEINYVIDYLSETNNELLSIETGYGATRVTYGRGSERLSQKVSIFPETLETIRTEIARENTGKTYFQSDRLGSVLFATNQEGEVLRYAARDVWGSLQIPVQGDINSAGIEVSLGFTNYSYDQVIDKYFAQARFYDAGHGRMLAVDPIRSGFNVYLYCENNPIVYVDPDGRERIVVSGGSDGAENFRYNFIETAIKQIKEWKAASSESITWSIAKFNYSADDLKNFKEVADSYDVTLLLIKDKQELFDHINKKGREADKITAMTFFVHGTAFDIEGTVENPGYENKYAIALGYNAVEGDEHDNALNIFVKDIKSINTSAFAKYNSTFFGSCRTGNKFGGVNFAQEWANRTNGKVKAAMGLTNKLGRTDYSKIFPDDRSILSKVLNKTGLVKSKASREKAREKYGFSEEGSINYPKPSTGARWKTFKPKK